MLIQHITAQQAKDLRQVITMCLKLGNKNWRSIIKSAGITNMPKCYRRAIDMLNIIMLKERIAQEDSKKIFK